MKLVEQEGKRVYSDTEELEMEMLKIAKEHPGDQSQDYIAKDNRYTINNTFSSVRHNLLNWYSFKEGATILEVGAGMGAMTGCLCEKAERVTSVEMSQKRAEVIRNRFPDVNNLTILCEDIFELQLSEKFDYVVVVGVLEYAAIFGKQYSNPFLEFVKTLKRFLKPDGIVLLAIENRFGLKYWCGASEDHLCQPFKGIAGYKEKETAVTFSKNGLKTLFRQAGFVDEKFYYVLPDYKFPTVVYTDDFYPTESVVQKLALNYVKGSHYIYDEKKLYKEIFENHVGDFFANSFLVEAFNGKKENNQPVYIACKGEIKKENRVSTLIYADKTVIKKAVHEDAKRHLNDILRNEKSLLDRGIRIIQSKRIDEWSIQVPYYHGYSAEERFHEKLGQNDKEGIKRLINLLRQSLLKSSDCFEGDCLINRKKKNDIKYGVILKQAYIDMTFSNCFLDDEDNLIFFDQEWMFEDIPVDFVTFQAVRQSYLSFVGKTDITLEQIYQMCNIYNLINDFIWLERYLWDLILYRQEHFYDGDGWYNQFDEQHTLEKELEYFNGIKEQWWEYKQIIEEKKGYIVTLEDGISKKNDYIMTLEDSINKKNDYISEIESENRILQSELNILKKPFGRLRRFLSKKWMKR